MNTLVEAMKSWLNGFEWFVLAYFLILNSTYLVLTVVATWDFSRYFRRVPYAGHDDIFANPMTPGISVVVAAHNEAIGIIDNVRAMLSLRYPLFEIVVVDDGSTDDTFALLRDEYDLVEIPWRPTGSLETRGEVLSAHIPRQGEPLVVVRKANAKARADASNVGINVARMPLVCIVDADSLLDPDALLRVVKPFVDDPLRVVASGGVIRPANGCVVERGSVVRAGMPESWLGRVQVVEYLRSFLLGRTGWSSLQCLLVISGAFGMFRRNDLLAIGGFDQDSMGEDAEVVTALHRYMRDNGRRDYRIVFVSEPVCWTEVPGSIEVLARQRKRWSRGLAEVLWKHRRMIFNPRYGRIGMVAMPYYLFFELLGPIVELLGLLTVLGVLLLALVSFVADVPVWLVDTGFAVQFALVALGYGFLLSLASLVVEEFSFHRMTSWKDLCVSFVASIYENVGYRQRNAWWRLQGLWWWLRKTDSAWGVMPRQGYMSTLLPAATLMQQLPAPMDSKSFVIAADPIATAKKETK